MTRVNLYLRARAFISKSGLDLEVSYSCIFGRQEEKKRKKQYNTKLMTCNLGMTHIWKCICTQRTHTRNPTKFKSDTLPGHTHTHVPFVQV